METSSLFDLWMDFWTAFRLALHSKALPILRASVVDLKSSKTTRVSTVVRSLAPGFKISGLGLKVNIDLGVDLGQVAENLARVLGLSEEDRKRERAESARADHESRAQRELDEATYKVKAGETKIYYQLVSQNNMHIEFVEQKTLEAMPSVHRYVQSMVTISKSKESLAGLEREGDVTTKRKAIKKFIPESGKKEQERADWDISRLLERIDRNPSRPPGERSDMPSVAVFGSIS
jgi:hypothetical protein